jgi:hypothetical protein
MHDQFKLFQLLDFMANKQIDKNLEVAQKLMDDFLARTGINGSGNNANRRYLWTDAFAVQACFSLSHEPNGEDYKAYALCLIDLVHSTLGKHRTDSPRKGWISGMSSEEGKKHPTAGGLRIGKKLSERLNGEPFSHSLEWERDGQYFHYLTRWFSALLQAYRETGNKKYALWASELINVGEKFINKDMGRIRMYWKMNINLTRPMVGSMGAHDPLEGLICTLSAIDAVPETSPSLERLRQDMEAVCQDMNWFTTDALGIGTLFLNTARAAELNFNVKPLPASIRPEYLFADSIAGLHAFAKQVYNDLEPASRRLAFRECGLALGFRVLYGLKDKYSALDMDFSEMDKFLYMVEEIEDFWARPSSQQSKTWLAHEDINAVTLASNLLAHNYPGVFCSASRI